MKNKVINLLIFFLLVLSIVCFSVACTPLEEDNGEPSHVHSYLENYFYDDGYHWLECECGEDKGNAPHVFTDGKCECGYEKDVDIPDTSVHTHEYSVNNFDNIKHWKECSCGAKSEVEQHKLINGVCVCSFEDMTTVHTHIYDRKNVDSRYVVSFADCENKAIYYFSCACGEKSTNVFENGLPLGHNFTNYVDNGNGVKIAMCDNGCGKTNIVESKHQHNYEKEVVSSTCTEKGYTVNTCDCGDVFRDKYTEPLNHDYGDWKSNGDGFYHTKTCKNDEEHKLTEKCAGGEATCVKKALCEVCGGEHGNYKKHEYTSELTMPTCLDEGYTTYSCVCGDNYKSDYTDSIGHDYGKFISDNDGIHHTKTCKNDSEHKVTENCVGGSATCTQKAICGYCNTEYGEYAPHKFEGEYLFDDNKHWKEATCGCDVISFNSAHASNGEICTDCEFPFAPTIGVMYKVVGGVSAQVTGYNGTADKIKIADTYAGVPVTSIGKEAFKDDDSITYLDVPDSIEEIGDGAFYRCDGLKRVVLGDGVKIIGAEAFYCCYNLEGIELPDGLVSVGKDSFKSCNSRAFTSIVIPDSVTTIGDGAFSFCVAINSVKIGSGVKTIGGSAFLGCTISSITIPDSVESIGQRAFYNCVYLTSVEIGKGVTSIGIGAFERCNWLGNVMFNNIAGWSVGSVAISADDLLDEETAATYLKQTYCTKTWTRAVS